MSNSYQMPRQRLPFSQKNKEWRKQNVDQAEPFSIYNSETTRQTLENRLSNLQLYNGRLNIKDLQRCLNPQGINTEFAKQEIPHHPILVPKIDLLVGEEINRKFDWFATITNPDAISIKEEEKKKVIAERLNQLLSQNYAEEELDKEYTKFTKYLKYEWQDTRERAANHLLKYYWEKENFSMKFNECFKDVLLYGEEIVMCDIESNEPVLRKLNTLKVYTGRSGNSSHVEDSDLIIIEDHMSPGKIIDEFWEELKAKDIDKLHEYLSGKGTESTHSDEEFNAAMLSNHVVDSYIDMASIDGFEFSNSYRDNNGNIRVLRVLWRSQKKIVRVKFYNNLGETEYRFESEEYIANKDIGEELEVFWVNEFWQGVKIDKDIYLAMRPRKIQYNSLSNPSKCHPGVVGEIYNTGQGRAVSLIDRMKQYQYLYDVIWDRLNTAIAKNLGKILLLDISTVPDGWDPAKWLHYASSIGIGFMDGFKEGSKGAAMGKLAGATNGSNTRAIDLETGNYIQQHISLLDFIKMEMGTVGGISNQREGNVSNRETVGGVERSVNQSSHITEWWFSKHEDFKKRVLSVFLDTAKHALKNNKKIIQYISDDLTQLSLEVDGDDIRSCDFDIQIVSSTNIRELKQKLDMMVQAFMQNGGSFRTVLDLYTSNSIADIRKKIENAEDEKNERDAKAQEEQSKQFQANLEQQQAAFESEQNLKKYEIDENNKTKLKIREVDAIQNQMDNVYEDLNRNHKMDDFEKDWIEIDRMKVAGELENKKLQLLNEMKLRDKEMKQEYDLKIKELESKEKIAKTKKVISSK